MKKRPRRGALAGEILLCLDCNDRSPSVTKAFGVDWADIVDPIGRYSFLEAELHTDLVRDLASIAVERIEADLDAQSRQGRLLAQVG
jgi:hypothetical protein